MLSLLDEKKENRFLYVYHNKLYKALLGQYVTIKVIFNCFNFYLHTLWFRLSVRTVA